MSDLTDRLRSAGADMDAALERVVGDEELYETCLHLFMDDPGFSALETALKSRNYSAAFKAAHTLKGVAGNLGLTDVYDAAHTLVELLRSDVPEGTDLNGPFQDLLSARSAVEALL